LFSCFVEIKKYTLWSLFLIVYLQWNAVLTQIMLCLAEAVLRNSRFFAVKKCILHGFQDLKALFLQPHFSCRDKFGQFR
jgi:hypothetical protein